MCCLFTAVLTARLQEVFARQRFSLNSTSYQDHPCAWIQEQIAHKTEFVRGLGAAAPVFIVGHSIGAHMGLEIMRALPSQVCMDSNC